MFTMCVKNRSINILAESNDQWRGEVKCICGRSRLKEALFKIIFSKHYLSDKGREAL